MAIRSISGQIASNQETSRLKKLGVMNYEL